jgi:hypothetical protein
MEPSESGLQIPPHEISPPPAFPDAPWETSQPPLVKALLRLVNGLEAGVIGGLAMLTLLIAGALWRGEVWWAPANLLGTTFYGRRAFHTGPGMATLAGAAFHLVITGTVGALFGLACGGVRERRRLVILGMLAGVFWYYLADATFWRWVNILVPAYAPQPSTLIAHAVFGACLGFMGQSLPRQTYTLELPPPLPPMIAPPPPPPAAEPDGFEKQDRVEIR